MKYLILVVFFSFSFVAQAKLYTVKPGERKVVTIKTFGAVTASSVSLLGVEGVSASLGRKLGADKVEVILNAASNAWGGSGKI
ncbi:MAG: hypothetical protein OQJ89_16725, partial [Kangiellaceae bacterium]|nr:hypothetical protein [Kangiellaceae bacterium]